MRHHRNRSLADLAPTSLAVIEAILDRAGIDVDTATTLLRPGHEPVTVSVEERPALVDVAGYRATA